MIEGKRINLRATTSKDLDELYLLQSKTSEFGDYDSLTFPTETWLKKDFNESGFLKKDHGFLLVTDKEDKILGLISYFKGLSYADGYEIGYKIFKKENRGKGYMTEALRIFTAYLFDINPIRRLQVNMFSGNMPSQKLAQKCGFTHEGTMRQVIFCRGKYHDVELFSMLREECPSFSEVMSNL